ncbi:VOC family protein [Deinococcus taeanensis]|nr:VOC family protein [Deinococcus taeanensis]
MGSTLDLMTVTDSPMADQMPAEHADRPVRGSLTTSTITLNASDLAGDITRNQSVSLILQCNDPAQAHTLFARLAQGGEITHPLGPSCWESTFGHVTDRYGIRWMINAPQA